MGCRDMSFLGCGSLRDFPSAGWCLWGCRRFWFLCWIERVCIDHDIFPGAWYVVQHKISIILILTNLFYFLFKETKQRTLEELDYVFAVPTSRHVSYQAKTFLPYFIQRYLFFRDVELEPLYNFDEVESVTVFEKGAGH